MPPESLLKKPGAPSSPYLWAALAWSLFLIAWPLARQGYDLGFLREPIPCDPETAIDLRIRVWSHFLFVLALGAGLCATAWAWGQKTTGVLALQAEQPLFRFARSAALGCLYLSLLATGLGLCGLWTAPVFTGTAVVLLIAALTEYLSQKTIRPALPIGLPTALWISTLCGILILLWCLLHALAPDVYYDSLVYHLAALDAWAHSHSIRDLSGIMYTRYPFGSECFFAWGYVLGGAETAKVLNVFVFMAAALGAAGWVKERTGSRDAAFLAFGAVALYPLSTIGAFTLHAEHLEFLYLMLFLDCLDRADRSSLWAGAALFAGAAFGVKYLAWFWIFLAILAFAVYRIRSSRPKSFQPVPVLGLFLIPILPWTLKNLVFCGNPVAPYLSIGSDALPDWGAQALLYDHQAAWNYWRDWSPAWFWTKWMDRSMGGPILLSALPILLVFRGGQGFGSFVRAASLLMLVLTAGLTLMFRLMLPVHLLVLTAACAVLGSQGKRRELSSAAWIVSLAALAILPILARVSVLHYQPGGLWRGRENAAQYLERLPQTDYLRPAPTWARLVGPEARVLRVGDSRGAYIPFEVTAESPFNEPTLARLAKESSSALDLARRVKRLGLTHLWVADAEGRRIAGLQPKAWAMDQAASSRLSFFLMDHARVLARVPPNTLLEISSPSQPGVGPEHFPWMDLDSIRQARRAHPEARGEGPVTP